MSEPITIPDEMEIFEFPNPDATQIRETLEGKEAFDEFGDSVPLTIQVPVDVYEASNWVRHVYEEAKEGLGDDFNDFAYLAMVGDMLAEKYGFPKSLRPAQVKFVADKVFELAAKKNMTSASTLQKLLS